MKKRILNAFILVLILISFAQSNQSVAYEEVFSAVEFNAIEKYGSGLKWAIWWDWAKVPPSDNLTLRFKIDRFPYFDSTFHMFVEIQTCLPSVPLAHVFYTGSLNSSVEKTIEVSSLIGEYFVFDSQGNEVNTTDMYKLLVLFGIQSPSLRDWYFGTGLRVELTYSVGGVEIGPPASVYYPNVDTFQSRMQCQTEQNTTEQNQTDNPFVGLITLAIIGAVLVLIVVYGKKLLMSRK
jgi:hypothetical protein